MSTQNLEPFGGNMYRTHRAYLPITNTMWMCRHGKTDFTRYRTFSCFRCWVGHKLDRLINRLANHEICERCHMEKDAKNIVNYQLMCDTCTAVVRRKPRRWLRQQ